VARPLVIYFKSVTYFSHSRRIFIAAHSKAEANRISGIAAGNFDYGRKFEAGSKEAPPFIKEVGVWMEIRDQDVEGAIEPEFAYSGSHKEGRVPTNEAAFVHCSTLVACKETFTLLLDRALAAQGIPREEL